MELAEITEALDKAKRIIAEAEEMIADCNACKSKTSKAYLTAAIMKLIAPFTGAIAK